MKELTHREIEILKLIVNKYTTDEIASSLFVSNDAVKTHCKHLMQKLNARNVAGMLRRAFEHQLIPLSFG